MHDTSASTLQRLTIRRTFSAPVARVYDAWTHVDAMRRWLGPGDITIAELDVDFRIGGTYRVVMLRPDGERFIVGGSYREIVARERLVYTWRWEEDRPEDEFDTLVTVEFLDRGESTEIVLTHELLKSEESRAAHEGGWNATLDKFEAYLRA